LTIQDAQTASNNRQIQSSKKVGVGTAAAGRARDTSRVACSAVISGSRWRTCPVVADWYVYETGVAEAGNTVDMEGRNPNEMANAANARKSLALVSRGFFRFGSSSSDSSSS